MAGRIFFLGRWLATAGSPAQFSLSELSQSAVSSPSSGAWMARSGLLLEENRERRGFFRAVYVAPPAVAPRVGVTRPGSVPAAAAAQVALAGLEKTAAKYASGSWLDRPAFPAVPAGTWLERAVVYPVASPVVPLCTARVTQIAAEVALAPSPHARLTHAGAEIAAQFIGQRARVTQLGVEVAICPDTIHARVTWVGREIMMRPMPVAGRRVLQVRPLFDASRIINRKGL